MKIGDTVICSTQQYGAYKNDDLIVGDKYIITDIIKFNPRDTFLSVRHEKTGAELYFIRYFRLIYTICIQRYMTFVR